MEVNKLIIKHHPKDFSITKVKSVDGVNLSKAFLFLAITNEEISVVLPTEEINFEIEKKDSGWNLFQIVGELDFALIGIIAEISRILAKHEISIFVISTYDTDYFLVKKENTTLVSEILGNEGHKIVF